MLGPNYGEWWNERPASKRARLGLAIIPIIVILAWVLYLYVSGARLGVQLFNAVERGDSAEVLSLLERGGSLAVQNRNGASLLHWAQAFGHHNLAALLIREGVDVNIVDRHGITPIYQAASRGDAALVALLIENGADANIRSPLPHPGDVDPVSALAVY